MHIESRTQKHQNQKQYETNTDKAVDSLPRDSKKQNKKKQMQQNPPEYG